jgi:hypothetical protein
MIYAVGSKTERDCRHIVKRTATSMGLEMVRKTDIRTLKNDLISIPEG